jgi:ABC-type uncharacterized transport system substrate-binding protein
MPVLRLQSLCGVAVVALISALWAPRAQAHPHVWITVETTVLHDKGTFTGFKHKWTFDEFYTAMAIEGLDKNGDGVYDRNELAELAKVNMTGLQEFSYFTHPALAGQELKLGEPGDYWLEHKDGVLSLHFTVALAQPVLMDAKGLTFSVSDPTYFIAFDLAKLEPVRLSQGAPAACKLNVGDPASAPPAPSGLGEAFSAQLGAMAVSMVKTVSVDCNAP